MGNNSEKPLNNWTSLNQFGNKMVEIPHYTYVFSREHKKGEYKIKMERVVTKSENRKTDS